MTQADLWPRIEQLLSRVERPGRYVDREWGARHTSDADYRAVLIYPDTYEIGQANQAIAILYGVLNALPGVSAERAYLPWLDMIAADARVGSPAVLAGVLLRRAGLRSRRHHDSLRALVLEHSRDARPGRDSASHVATGPRAIRWSWAAAPACSTRNRSHRSSTPSSSAKARRLRPTSWPLTAKRERRD